ncbi:MAG: 5'-methylthioadenosine/S-adenosylhomocysteine nucleosidase [Clostridia bacterium]|nr:5'-methylthioadenosine/S-adenosylhomocysteine nucleosidase [Clostridia bacterium]
MKCFVIAMECEAVPVIEAMENIQRDESLLGFHLVQGEIAGEKLYVLVSGIGKVNAGRATQYAVSVLGATAIINIGVAGGLKAGMHVAEIYGVSAAVQYDFDLVQINHTPMGTLNECEEPLLPLDTTELYPLEIVGSGDRFNDDPADFRLLTQTLGAGIRDMELAAVKQVCMHCGVSCYSFKVISDVAGGEESTPDQYMRNQALCFDTERREIRNIVAACR